MTSPSYTRVYPLVVSRAEGAVIEDVDGNRFLDFNAGIAVCSTGHCHPRVVEAIHRQSSQLLHMSGTDFYYRSQFELAEKLTQITPGTFPKKVFFTNSGTEAVEAAFKLARYHTKRQQMIAFLGAFHGRTMGSLSLTASKVTQRRGFGPLVPGVTHTGYANCRECPQHLTYGDCGIECVATIEKNLFHRLMAPDEVAAIFVEPIQGEGGYIVPPPEFHRDLKALTEKHGILLVADEVQSGMGRTGRMCAIEHWNVVPDIICLAKGIASGLPLGAIIARADIMDWPPGAHASTFGGNPGLLCRGARDDCPRSRGVDGERHAARRFPDGSVEGDANATPGNRRRPRQGFDDRRRADQTGHKQEPAPEAAEQLVQTCFQKGLLLLRCGVSSVRLCPPLVITREQAETALALIEEALVDMEKGDVHRTRGVPTPTESKQA